MRVLVMTVCRRAFFPLLAPTLVPAVFSVLAPNPIRAGETPSFLVTTAPAERLSPSVTWLDDLEHRLTTYFTKKYPAYDFLPYAQELSRIRRAVSPAIGGRNAGDGSVSQKDVTPEIAVHVRTTGGGSDHGFAYTRH